MKFILHLMLFEYFSIVIDLQVTRLTVKKISPGQITRVNFSVILSQYEVFYISNFDINQLNKILFDFKDYF